MINYYKGLTFYIRDCGETLMCNLGEYQKELFRTPNDGENARFRIRDRADEYISTHNITEY